MFLTAESAFAQGAPVKQTAPVTQTAQGVQVAREQIVKARLQIANMENALKTAVRSGASRGTKQLANIGTVESATFLGPPDAQGFIVPQGVFFYVKVPAMSSAVALWMPLIIEQQQARGPRRAQAQSVSQAREVEVVPPVSPMDANVLKNTYDEYRNAIKDALIDSMLRDSGALEIDTNAFLTVAARRDARPNPLDLTDEVRTVTLTVKGSVLDEFHQKRITFEEARKLVEMRED
jgi:hypothetical protein